MVEGCVLGTVFNFGTALWLWNETRREVRLEMMHGYSGHDNHNCDENDNECTNL
jgi:hypothetical protein